MEDNNQRQLDKPELGDVECMDENSYLITRPGGGIRDRGERDKDLGGGVKNPRHLRKSELGDAEGMDGNDSLTTGLGGEIIDPWERDRNLGIKSIRGMTI